MPDYLDICEKAARAGGEVLLDWQGRIHAQEKGPRDLVTEADLASQKVIEKIVCGEFPDHDFVGEEGDTQSIGSADFRWIVDPLDGTTNYVHQLPNFAVSIAMQAHGQLEVATVFDPITNECFTAKRGQGAFLNGTQIQVSDCEQMDQSLMAASFSANVPRGSDEVLRFIEVLHECQALRRMGSCALNLCYVAAGRLDGYWASSVKPWDAAAGILLVQEAGGVITNLTGQEFDLWNPKLITASTEILHGRLLGLLTSSVGG